MPEVRFEEIRGKTLNEPDKKQRQGHEGWSMSIVGGIVRRLIKKPEKGWIGIESIDGIVLVVWLIHAHTIVMYSDDANSKIQHKPYKKQRLFDAGDVGVGHGS